MKTTSATSGSAQRGLEWTVLARLPDVSDQLPSVAQRSAGTRQPVQPGAGSPSGGARAAAAGFVNYRFDPPQNVESGARTAAGMADSTYAGEVAASRPAQPHIFRRSQTRAARGKSPILPHSNPFAIPRTSLYDRLAPMVRFLILFALFTAIGTSLLTIQGRGRAAKDVVEPATTSVQRSLESQTLKPSDEIIEPPAAMPTAAGPLGTKTPRTGLKMKASSPPAAEDSHSAATPTSSASPIVAEAKGDSLPQVQTSDEESVASEQNSTGPPAIARLRGYILEAPTRQAQHDENQPSLH